MTEKIHLDTKELDRIAKQLNMKTEQVLMRMAFQVEDEYKQNAPVKTSAMANSCYVEGKNESDWSASSSAASNANPEVVMERHPAPTGKVVANVGPSVEYAAYVEFGTSRASAQPTLGPAVEKIASKYNNGSEWKEITR